MATIIVVTTLLEHFTGSPDVKATDPPVRQCQTQKTQKNENPFFLQFFI